MIGRVIIVTHCRNFVIIIITTIVRIEIIGTTVRNLVFYVMCIL